MLLKLAYYIFLTRKEKILYPRMFRQTNIMHLRETTFIHNKTLFQARNILHAHSVQIEVRKGSKDLTPLWVSLIRTLKKQARWRNRHGRILSVLPLNCFHNSFKCGGSRYYYFRQTRSVCIVFLPHFRKRDDNPSSRRRI